MTSVRSFSGRPHSAETLRRISEALKDVLRRRTSTYVVYSIWPGRSGGWEGGSGGGGGANGGGGGGGAKGGEGEGGGWDGGLRGAGGEGGERGGFDGRGGGGWGGVMVVTETFRVVMGTESFSASALVTALLSTVMASAAAEGLPTTCEERQCTW